MTSSKLSKDLEKIGRKISDATVRKDWGRGAPRNSAEAYLRWKEKQDTSSRADPALRELKTEKLRAEIDVLKERLISEQRDNEKRAGELVSIEAVHQQQDHCVARARAVLDQKLITEIPPKCDGMPAADIAAMMQSALDEVLGILSKRETYN